MTVQRQRFLKQKAAAITIQSAYRGHCARVQHARMQASATLIQKWYRSLKRLAKRRRAAIKIQSAMRMHVYRKRYVLLRSSVLKLQCVYLIFMFGLSLVYLRQHFRLIKQDNMLCEHKLPGKFRPGSEDA
uniref:Calmodulin binding transcription activator 2 n=1 Tax=Sinocyclocheilus grahami TaxID=75366 RepID=A0A672R6W3_SINGR